MAVLLRRAFSFDFSLSSSSPSKSEDISDHHPLRHHFAPFALGPANARLCKFLDEDDHHRYRHRYSDDYVDEDGEEEEEEESHPCDLESSNDDDDDDYVNFDDDILCEYIIERSLSEEGNVYSAKHRFTSKDFALKCYSKHDLSPKNLSRVHREISSLRKCSHLDHVIDVFDVVESESEIILVTELAKGGDLHDYLTSIRPSRHIARWKSEGSAEFGRLFMAICCAVKEMHHLGYVHRDVKPENVFLDRTHNQPLLGDFGFATKFTPGTTMYTRCGSLYYAAPEVLTFAGYEGPEVDVWSLGILLYVMYNLKLPFHGRDDEETLELILSAPLDLPGRDPVVEDLIVGMLRRNRKVRYTMDQVLSHKWLRQWGYTNES